ncbi:MAG: hypothetical protein ISS59_08470 [Desulfobacteraceae bacterium]|nr:hypothetical protein [Desulfobacteraceae bacterium]
MIIEYLFSSPEGDISLGPEDLARPFLITPSEHHPFLTLGDYFNAIREFIFKDQGKRLAYILKERLNREIDPDSIHKILIRSEKHGALYHLASVEVFADDKQTKFAVSTAVSEKGKGWLTHEYEILNLLNSSLKLPYLPNVCLKGEMKCQAGNGKHETLSMLLSEWFEEYHEWHLSIDENDNNQKLCIWDLRQGHRYASEKESYEIFRQASRILTLYYDTLSYKQIYPWHHAAGDFIVKTRDRSVDVRLTTVREYQSIMNYFSEETANPMIAIVYFFLNLTIRMRLDKLDGVGETVWAGDFSVDAATKGFFEALRLMKGEGRFKFGQIDDLLSLLQSINEDELERLLQPLLDLYEEDDPADLFVILANSKSHVNLLYRALQDFRL